MQITLVEAEIKEAISDFVLRRMSINDDMELAIDMSATRGSVGFTANIDVVPKVEVAPLGVTKKVAAAKKAAAESKAEPKAVATTVAKTGSAGTAQAETQAQEAVQEAAEAEQVEVAAEAQAEAEPTPEAAPEPAAEAVEEEPAPTPKTSLFGNLTKPVNEKPVEG